MPTRFPGPSGTFEGHLDFDLARVEIKAICAFHNVKDVEFQFDAALSPKHCNHSDLTLAEIKLLLSFFVLAGRIMVSCGFEGLAESITNYDEVSASPLNHLRYAGVRARIVDPYRGFGIPDQPL
ncbi:hypothetical protein RhiJN_10303 [Ceratobasidium sp. AG-Ba]|nr:hypothetical protein RhiJN_10303 [Ceratobasidium sp. AG-Ba]